MGSTSRYKANQNKRRGRRQVKHKRENMKKARAARGREIQVAVIEPQNDDPGQEIIDPLAIAQEVSEAQDEVIDVPELYSSPVIPLIRKTPSHIPPTKAKKVNVPSVFPQVPSQSFPSQLPPPLPPQSPGPSCKPFKQCKPYQQSKL